MYAERLTIQGRMVNLVASADIRRRFWEPLAAVGTGFELTDLPANAKHGGQIRMAVASKGAG